MKTCLLRLLFAAVLGAPSVLRSQAAPTPATVDSTAKRKSGVTATILSGVVPGLGHFYAHDNTRGTILLGIFATGVALGAGGENAVTPAGLVLIGLPWWYGVLTAHTAVDRYNRGLEAKLTVLPAFDRSKTGRGVPSLQFGLSAVW